MFIQDTVVDRGESPFRLDINLHELFPISKRSIIRRSFRATLRFLMLLVTVAAVGTVVSQMWHPVDRLLTYKWLIVGAIVLVALLCFVGKVAYEFMYRNSLEFGISRHNFYIKRGVFMQDVGSFPLSRITDIYLERRFSDYLLGLASFVIATPSSKSAEFARINGLKHRDAAHLKGLLGAVVHGGQSKLGDEPLFVDLAEKNGLTVGELKVLLLENDLGASVPPMNRNGISEPTHVSNSM